MDFKETLKNVIVRKRVHRFIVDIEDVNGNIKSAYLSNNTKMIDLFEKNNTKGMISNQPKGRRLEYKLEMLFSQGTLVGVNHNNTVKIVQEALENKQIPELSSFYYKKKVKNNKGDILELENSIGNKCILVVRDIYLKKASTLVYPDGIYPYETALLKEMNEWIEKKYKVAILYIAQRSDAIDARLGWEIDSDYSNELANLVKKGAEVLCYYSWMSFKDIKLKNKLEFKI